MLVLWLHLQAEREAQAATQQEELRRMAAALTQVQHAADACLQPLSSQA